jgi:hypothetical protein
MPLPADKEHLLAARSLDEFRLRKELVVSDAHRLLAHRLPPEDSPLRAEEEAGRAMLRQTLEVGAEELLTGVAPAAALWQQCRGECDDHAFAEAVLVTIPKTEAGLVSERERFAPKKGRRPSS